MANGLVMGSVAVERLPHELQVAAAQAHVKFTGGEPGSPNYLHVDHLDEASADALSEFLEGHGVDPDDVDLILF